MSAHESSLPVACEAEWTAEAAPLGAGCALPPVPLSPRGAESRSPLQGSPNCAGTLHPAAWGGAGGFQQLWAGHPDQPRTMCPPASGPHFGQQHPRRPHLPAPLNRAATFKAESLLLTLRVFLSVPPYSPRCPRTSLCSYVEVLGGAAGGARVEGPGSPRTHRHRLPQQGRFLC